jgi:hypothetical protein
LLVPAGRALLVREPDSGHSGYRRAVPAAATAEPTIRGGDAAWLRRSCLQSWRPWPERPPEVGMRGGLPHCCAVAARWRDQLGSTELRNREKVKHSPYRRSTRRAFRRKPRASNPTSSDGRSFEGTNRRARSVMPDQWRRVYNAMHTPVSTEANSTLTTANPARTEHIPTGRVP